ncbi:helix-hairpin-helix domain-containing protein, partial [Nocardiopsis protaetiae]
RPHQGRATDHPATAATAQPWAEQPTANRSSGTGEPATGGETAPTPARPRGGRPHQGRATDHPATAATAQPWAEQPTANRSSGTGEPATGGETADTAARDRDRGSGAGGPTDAAAHGAATGPGATASGGRPRREQAGDAGETASAWRRAADTGAWRSADEDDSGDGRRPGDPGATEEAAPDGRGRRRRGDDAEEGIPRVPSGYTEFLPPRGGVVERLTRRWPPEATMSRRAVAALLVLALIAIAAVLFLRERPTEAVAPETVAHTLPAEAAAPGAAAADPEADVVVHVGGEVEDPGLYTLPPGSRVADAVEAAGGALPDADMDLLNLARSLVDGEQILVGLPQPAAAVPPAGTAEGPLVNINQAGEAELETLPRVGEVTAGNIVSYREANGPFTSVDDLINVDRIGTKTLEEIRPHVTVG